MSATDISRRHFLHGTGSLVVGFTLLGRAEEAPGAQRNGRLRVDPVGRRSASEAWLVLTATTTTVYSGKVELGTGVQTALTQIVVEELRLRVDDVRFVQGDTLLTPSQGFTADSTTIQQGGVTLRQAAATAYHALLQMAGTYLRANPSRLVARGARFHVIGTDRSVSYRTLLALATTIVTLDPNAPVRSPSQYAVVGTDAPRVDLPAKVTGDFRFTTDVTLRGMLHGRVIRPSGRNAALRSITHLSRAHAIPGFVMVVRKGNFVAVVAKSEWAAARAANPQTGINVTWRPGPSSSPRARCLRHYAIQPTTTSRPPSSTPATSTRLLPARRRCLTPSSSPRFRCMHPSEHPAPSPTCARRLTPTPESKPRSGPGLRA
jgi:nicotinate dehydrogenase subunit B